MALDKLYKEAGKAGVFIAPDHVNKERLLGQQSRDKSFIWGKEISNYVVEATVGER